MRYTNKQANFQVYAVLICCSYVQHLNFVLIFVSIPNSYPQGKLFFSPFSTRIYWNRSLAASALFPMFTQSIKLYTFHYHILTLLWRQSLSYRNQSIDLLCKLQMFENYTCYKERSFASDYFIFSKIFFQFKKLV